MDRAHWWVCLAHWEASNPRRFWWTDDVIRRRKAALFKMFMYDAHLRDLANRMRPVPRWYDARASAPRSVQQIMARFNGAPILPPFEIPPPFHVKSIGHVFIDWRVVVAEWYREYVKRLIVLQYNALYDYQLNYDSDEYLSESE